MEIQTISQIFIGSYVICSRTYYIVLVILLLPYYMVLAFRAPPVVPGLPFIMGWNAPTEKCVEKFKLSLDLSLFSFVGSTHRKAIDQNITIFYTDRLGYYPYINEITGEARNEGIPQLASLKNHLAKAKKDIIYYIPKKDTFGLVVIDWENWRPNWVRNWKPKEIYRTRSIELIHQLNIKLNDIEAHKAAQKGFEKAARNFMEETLRLGKSLRPNHLWGYYLFPDCYNYYKGSNYNGNCFDIEIARNNELNWLWKESTALFPSIYISKKLKNSHKIHLFVRNRIKEAIRVSQVVNINKPLPIFVYMRPVFEDASSQYLSEDDLVNTIGESVALGVSGIIMWGSLNFTRSQKTCTVLDNYMRTTLNPYIINATLAAKMCSQVLCQDQGACVRKNWNSSDYLHLNSKRFSIRTQKGRSYVRYGKPNFEDLKEFSEKFYCNCYSGSKCKTEVTIENVHDIKVCISEDICIEAHLDSEHIVHTFKSPTWKRVLSSPRNVLPGIEDQQVASTAFDRYGIGIHSNNDRDNTETDAIKYNFGMSFSTEVTLEDTENGVTQGLYKDYVKKICVHGNKKRL
ncbi:hyaluronidase PH-20-like isoform X2 [Macrotis lagotis]|uniref:hyaluronidase PH-20-like isoform X2 n=1 Tax=Macrotis lagotis TaxID=92651 RepID=UPI003D685DF5